VATKKSTKTSAKRTSKPKRPTKTVKKKTSPKKRTKSASSTPSKKSTTSKPASRKKSSSKKVDEDVKLDRRLKADRRDEELSEIATPPLERRKKVQRRRQIDPTTCERDYSVVEVEFMNAMDDYKRKSGRMFPTCSEILEVIRAIGYTKQSPAEQAILTEVQEFEFAPEQKDEASAELVGVGFSIPTTQAMEESVSWCI